MITTFKRIILAGALNFWRNGWLSTATISVMMLALSMVLGLVLLSVLTEALVGES